MNLQKTLLLFTTLFFSSQFLMANEDKEEARPEVRLTAAKKALLEKTQISLIYVKGLVCPSCAIGIRKNLSKMKGVDKLRFKDGIDMNPETQLVSIALKANFKIDNKDLIERVEDAGYIAVEEYKLHDGHLDALQFKRDASVKVVHHTHN
ncbi:MAG: heavy metal-associated domain-containing protein [Opitutales bacterium]|nr:heavy metal-associated domain-containing protein [Opitutales bacterium]